MHASNMCKVVLRYEKVMLSDEMHFGNGMKSQAKSHVHLIKTIAAIIAFESVKMNRRKRKSNLKKYRIPIDIQVFYDGFVSHSRQARKAMDNLLVYHNFRKSRQPIFALDGTSNTF